MAMTGWMRHAIMGADSVEDCFAREGLPIIGNRLTDWGDRISQPVPGALAIPKAAGQAKFIVVDGADENGYVRMIAVNANAIEPIQSYRVELLNFYWPKGIDLPTSHQPLLKSNVIRGASLALMSSLAVFSSSVTEILTAINKVKVQMSDGSVYSLIASGVIIVGLLIVLGSRVRGKMTDAKLLKES